MQRAWRLEAVPGELPVERQIKPWPERLNVDVAGCRGRHIIEVIQNADDASVISNNLYILQHSIEQYATSWCLKCYSKSF